MLGLRLSRIDKFLLPLAFTIVPGALVNLWIGFVIADVLTYRAVQREAEKYLIKAVYDVPTTLLEEASPANDLAEKMEAVGQFQRANELRSVALEIRQVSDDYDMIARRSFFIKMAVENPEAALHPEFVEGVRKTEALKRRVGNASPNYFELFVWRVRVLKRAADDPRGVSPRSCATSALRVSI